MTIIEYWYEILGVPYGSDPSIFEPAFRRKAMEHHPDVGGETAEFRRCREAVGGLRDLWRERRYWSKTTSNSGGDSTGSGPSAGPESPKPKKRPKRPGPKPHVKRPSDPRKHSKNYSKEYFTRSSKRTRPKSSRWKPEGPGDQKPLMEWLLERIRREYPKGRLTTLRILRAFRNAVGYRTVDLASIIQRSVATTNGHLDLMFVEGLVDQDEIGWSRTPELVKFNEYLIKLGL